MCGIKKVKMKRYFGEDGAISIPETETFAFYKRKGYEGCDVSLETSLYEYGLIWGKNDQCAEDEYHFIYFVEPNEEQDDNQLFGHGYKTKEDFKDMILNDGWFEWDAFKSFIGWEDTVEKFIDTFPHQLDSCITYYGYENVMGSEYNPFEIRMWGNKS